MVRDALDPGGLKARAAFDALISRAAQAGDQQIAMRAQQAVEDLMRMRLNANKMIGRRDAAAAAGADQQLARLNTFIARLDGETAKLAYRDAFDALRGGIAAYADAYHKAFQISRDLNARVNGDMAQDAQAIAQAAAAIRDSGIADQKRIEQSTLAEIAATQTYMAVLALAGLLLGLCLAWFTGSGIARPVQRMTEAMHRLAGGDLAADIPALDRGDEVGQMAQAMLVFRRNAEEARALQGAAEQVREAKDRRQAAMDRHTQDFGTSASGVMTGLARAAEAMRARATEMSATARAHAQPGAAHGGGRFRGLARYRRGGRGGGGDVGQHQRDRPAGGARDGRGAQRGAAGRGDRGQGR